MQCKTNQSFKHGVFNRIGILAGCLAFSTTAMALNVSIPYVQNFDDSSYESSIEGQNLVWTSTSIGATHTWEESRGWGGSGAAKFTPPTGGEGYSGLGQIHFTPDENGDYPTHVNVRFLIYHGPTWVEYAGGNKVIIMNRPPNERDVAQLSDSIVNRIIDDFSNDYPELTSREDFLDNDFGFDVGRRALRRPMIISRQPGDHVVYGSCDNTVCNYNVHHNNQEPYWPDGNDQFRIGDPAIGVNSMGQVWEQVEEEWVSVEFEVDTVEGYIRTYVYTQSGRIAGEIVTKQMAYPGSSLKYIDILGGYMGQAIQADPGNYFMIDNLAIDTSYIGPPEGFVNGDTTASNVYYSTNPRLRSLSVMSLAENNVVTAGDRTLNLGLYERGSLWSPDERVVTPGMMISATGPLDMGSITTATDTPVPASMLGQSFAMPQVRGQHYYHMLSPERDASVEILVEGTAHQLTLPHGEPVSFDVGNANSNVSAVITSNTPIAVSHGAYENGTPSDAMPLPPAARELWGVRSTGVAIGATEDDTQVTVYASDGSTQRRTLHAGQRTVVTIGSNLSQGRGSAIHIVADKPVNAMQVADGDGLDATAFYPTSLLNARFGIPKNAQYVAITCPQPDTRVELHKANGSVEVMECSAQGNYPGKAYYGNGDSNGVSIPQGSYLESDKPIHVIYEVTGSEDEHNLVGAPAR